MRGAENSGRKSTDVGGVRMHWEEQGRGVPVVLVHGIPTSSRLWRHVLPRVAGARLLAWDMVGYGASVAEGEGRDISVARQAEYLAAWMETLELGGAILVGHDLGGGVAQILAVERPELVKGLVLTNTICYDSWPIPSVRLLQALGPFMRRLPDGVLWMILIVLFYRGHVDRAKMREALAVHRLPYAEVDGMAVLIRQILALDTRDTLRIADKLSELRVPARIVWGAADRFLPITYGERLARDLEAPLDRIEGGKHYVPEDYPERVAAAIQGLVHTIQDKE